VSDALLSRLIHLFLTEKSHGGDISGIAKAFLRKAANDEGFFKPRPSFAQPNYARTMLQKDVPTEKLARPKN
jgi:hypothetical protein